MEDLFLIFSRLIFASNFQNKAKEKPRAKSTELFLRGIVGS